MVAHGILSVLLPCPLKLPRRMLGCLWSRTLLVRRGKWSSRILVCSSEFFSNLTGLHGPPVHSNSKTYDVCFLNIVRFAIITVLNNRKEMSAPVSHWQSCYW